MKTILKTGTGITLLILTISGIIIFIGYLFGFTITINDYLETVFLLSLICLFAAALIGIAKLFN